VRPPRERGQRQTQKKYEASVAKKVRVAKRVKGAEGLPKKGGAFSLGHRAEAAISV